MNKRLFVLLALFCLVLCSCNNSRFSDEELKETAGALIDSSAQINEIFFGGGLPVDEVSSVVDEDDDSIGNYCRVSEQSPYKTVQEVKDAAEKVFSESYLDLIYESAFEGTVDSRPRYGTDSEGYLTRDITIETKQTDEWTKWDKNTIKIKNASSSTVVFSIDGSFCGKTETEVMQMVYTSDGWRLDSPTY